MYALVRQAFILLPMTVLPALTTALPAQIQPSAPVAKKEWSKLKVFVSAQKAHITN
jgi:hypothetical protein